MRKLTISGFIVLTLAVGFLAGAIMFGSDEGAIGPKDAVEADPTPPTLTAYAFCSDLVDENNSQVKFDDTPADIIRGEIAQSLSGGCGGSLELTGCAFVISPPEAKVWFPDSITC